MSHRSMATGFSAVQAVAALGLASIVNAGGPLTAKLHVELVDPSDPVRAGGANGTWAENGYDAAALDTYRVYAAFLQPEELFAVGDGSPAPPGLEVSSSAGVFLNGGLGSNGDWPPVDLTAVGPGVEFYRGQWDTYLTIAGLEGVYGPGSIDDELGGLIGDFTVSIGWSVGITGRPNTTFDPATGTYRAIIAQLTVTEGAAVEGSGFFLVLATGSTYYNLGFAAGSPVAAEVELALVVRSAAGPSDFAAALPTSAVSLAAGDGFVAELWARDIGALQVGLNAVHANVNFDPSVVEVLAIDHRPAFSVFPGGVIDDQLGSVTNLGGGGASCTGTAGWARVAVLDCAVACAGATSLYLSVAATDVSVCAQAQVPSETVLFGGRSFNIGQPCPYDLDGTGFINVADLSPFAACWLSAEGEPTYDAACDFDCSGFVAGGDLGWFAAGWLTSCGALAASDLPTCRQCGPSALAAEDAGDVLIGWGVRRTSSSTSSAALQAGVRAGEIVVLEISARDDTAESSGLTAVYLDVAVAPDEALIVGASVAPGLSLLPSSLFEPHGAARIGGATLAEDVGVGAWAPVAQIRLRALRDLPATPAIRIAPSFDGIAARGRGTIADDGIEVVRLSGR